jgi:hypothetical protein
MRTPLRLPWPIAGALMLGTLVGCGGDPFTPDAPPPAAPTTLTASSGALALAASGQARHFTLTNTGTAAAVAIAAQAPGLPAGTLVASTCGTALAPGASCQLAVTPGATPSAAPGDTAPLSVAIHLAGSNTNTLSLNVSVLTHGSVHQAGYLFAIDDTTPATGSIGGKVVALADQSNGILWSTAQDAIAGINETSIASAGSCNGATDGACNSSTINATYPGNPGDHAAGLCGLSTDGGFNDWYLPSLCEMGYEVAGGAWSAGGTCGLQGAPLLADNMQTRLVDSANIGGLTGFYWSSTQASFAAASTAFFHIFDTTPMGQSGGAKAALALKTRCVRAITR